MYSRKSWLNFCFGSYLKQGDLSTTHCLCGVQPIDSVPRIIWVKPITRRITALRASTIVTLCLRLMDQYSMSRFRSKLIFVRVISPRHSFHLNCCLCCSLKTQTVESLQSPVEQNTFKLSGSWAFYFHEPSSASVSILPPTLCTSM